MHRNANIIAAGLSYDIKLLADCSYCVPKIAQLWLENLGQRWNPNFTIVDAQERIITHGNKDKLPMAWVALANNLPVGMVALRVNELCTQGAIRPEFTPWLGALVVHPNYRNQGIALKLVEAVKSQARKLQYKNLYLLTFEKSLVSWYTKLNWDVVDTDTLYGHAITIMKTALI